MGALKPRGQHPGQLPWDRNIIILVELPAALQTGAVQGTEGFQCDFPEVPVMQGEAGVAPGSCRVIWAVTSPLRKMRRLLPSLGATVSLSDLTLKSKCFKALSTLRHPNALECAQIQQTVQFKFIKQ